MSEKKTDKKWLIKNNNQIIGPLTQFAVEKEFEKGHISLFATACVPGQEFWSFIIAFPEFASLADKTQLSQLTKTFGTSSLKTISLYSGTHKERDSTSFTKNKDSNSHFSVQELPYNVIEDTTEPSIIKNIKKKRQLLFIWLSVVFIIAGVFFFALYKRKLSLKKAKMSSYSHIGGAYFSTGFYLEALQIWQKAQQENQLDKKDRVLMQLVNFQLNDDISQAGAVDHLNKPKTTILELRKVVRALTQLKAGSLTIAQESLNKVIYESQWGDVKKAAIANLALLSANIGNCRFFDEYGENSFENKHLFHFAFSLCLIQSSTISPEQQKQAETLLKKIIKSEGSYYQEALVGLAYIQARKGEAMPSSLMENLLDRSPYLTDNYYYDIFIDRKIYSWPQMLPMCKAIYSKKPNDKFFVAFYAYCLARSKSYNSAKKFIERAVSIDSTNVLIKAIYAYITETINLKDQSALILGDAIRSNSDRDYVLPYILQARFCEIKTDWECAVENWRLVLKNRPHSLAGLGGLSYAKYQQGYYAEAKEYMNRGQEIDTLKLYSPLKFVETVLKD